MAVAWRTGTVLSLHCSRPPPAALSNRLEWLPRGDAAPQQQTIHCHITLPHPCYRPPRESAGSGQSHPSALPRALSCARARHADPRNARKARLPRPTPASVAALHCTRARFVTRVWPRSPRSPRAPFMLSKRTGRNSQKQKEATPQKAAPWRVAAPPRTDARRKDCGMHAACRPPKRTAYRRGVLGAFEVDQRYPLPPWMNNTDQRNTFSLRTSE